MPEENFFLQTEFSSYPHALVIDEIGEIATHLVDTLLNHGCFVSYYGKEKFSSFHYLTGKDNFSYRNSLAEIEPLKKIDYLFFFTERETSQIGEVTQLAQKSQAKLLVCLASSLGEKEKWRFLIGSQEVNARLAIFDSVFGPRIQGSLGKYFQQAVLGEKVVVNDFSEQKIMPLAVSNLVGELVKLIFSADTRGKSFLLSTDKISLGDFLGQIKKVLPNFHYVFTGESHGQKEGSDGLEKIMVSQNLPEELEKTADWFLRENKGKIVPPPIEPTPKAVPLSQEELVPSLVEKKEELAFLFQEPVPASKPKKLSFWKKLFRGLVILFLITLVFFLTPALMFCFWGIKGVQELKLVEKEMQSGRFELASKHAEQAKETFGLTQKILTVTGPFYGLLNLDREVNLASEVLVFSQNLADASRFAIKGAEEASGLLNSFLGNGSADWAEAISLLRTDLSFAYERASLSQSSLEKVAPAFKFFKQNDVYEKLKKNLPETREVLIKSQNLLRILPQLLAVGTRKTYLILLQNNMELRPTGGFIGSYGLANLENGKLVSFEVFDVYQADGQMKGHVEPPPKLKEYLGEAAWYLRDSNWDPEFAVSARKAQWFLDKEMQVVADGTMAVTLEVARNLLSFLGEVNIPEYQEKISKDNLFQKAEYYSELGTFPGSTQKKDFLGSLTKAIFEKIRSGDQRTLMHVGNALLTSLQQKEIQLYFNEPELEKAVAELGWEGGIREYQAQKAGRVLVDYLHLNEANVGINKANYFITRQINQEVDLSSEGTISEKLILTYDNQSPSESWPAGPYKFYLRLYLPLGTRLTSVLANDPANPGLWLPYDARLLTMEEEHGKSLFGFLLEVPIKSQKKIEISYELPDKFDFTGRVSSYLLLAQKQSGAYPSNYTLNFLYPPNLVPLRVIPSAIIDGQKLLVTRKFNQDLVFQVDLAR